MNTIVLYPLPFLTEWVTVMFSTKKKQKVGNDHILVSIIYYVYF